MSIHNLNSKDLELIIELYTKNNDFIKYVVCENCNKISCILLKNSLEHEKEEDKYNFFCNKCEKRFPICCIKKNMKYCINCTKNCEIIKDKNKIIQKDCIIKYDGSSMGRDERGGASAVIYIDGKEIEALALHLEKATNNEAEYHGAILCAKLAQKHKITNVILMGDSMLVKKQTEGQWKTNVTSLKNLQNILKNSLNGISYEFKWIPREENKRADQICYAAMQSQFMGDEYTKPQENFSRPK